ncbi:peptidase C39 [Mycoplasma capricolum subsp. capripneumoniae]|nr:peptidase C39 [Mycoplasma capricolum subsp. capripneumoniae]QIN45878.1 peptidase C39 [Mycoplasma capricolum subsp. capripneumoniae]QIN47265.1 peptidase C39 [Mycoplasma capricolum subsp. capripneumoniae]QIN48637.1 peptidase C39 [Mycoplasma capricolum subsp. capripneumoniae]QIN49325.1 peptidase C39 [Mycoplasma capricolum subsp. capripneumoniae]
MVNFLKSPLIHIWEVIFIKLIKQREYNDCSIACLVMIINYYYNQNYDLDRLKLELNYSEEILSFYDITQICQKYFLTTKALQIQNDLEQINKKVYLAQVVNQVGLLHFVVVEKQNNHLIIYDPLKDKKEKITYKDFYEIFTGYVLIFNSNYKKFKANYTSLFKLFDFYLGYCFYIILNIFSILLTILEMRFLYVYSLSIINQNNSYFLYLYFLCIFLINIFLNEISKFLLNKYYQKTKTKKLEIFYYYYYLVENNIKLDVINSYSEIEFISSFQTYVLLNTISGLINSLVILFVIFYINKIIFLVLFSFDIFWLLISLVHNFFINKNKKTSKASINLLTHFIDKNKLIDEKLTLKIINKDIFKNQIDYLSILFNVLEKISMLLIYYLSWDLLKFNYIEFSILLIIILFKAIHTSDLKKLVYFLQNFIKYKQLLIKFNNYKTTNNYLRLNEINNIKDISKFSLNKHICHLDDLEIKYTTILQNIIINQSELNIFNHNLIQTIIKKYQINLVKVINLENVSKLEQEFIKLLRIFYLDYKYLLFNDNFEIIDKKDISLVLDLFRSYSNSSLILTSNDIKYNLISKD